MSPNCMCNEEKLTNPACEISKPHPHAELMKLYAEDAALTDKPWELWEFRGSVSGSWHALDCNPAWSPRHSYRRKPSTRVINGFEVPVPLTAATLHTKKSYWVCDPSSPQWAWGTCNFTLDILQVRLERGIVFATKEDAVANAKAMSGIDPYK